MPHIRKSTDPFRLFEPTPVISDNELNPSLACRQRDVYFIRARMPDGVTQPFRQDWQ